MKNIIIFGASSLGQTYLKTVEKKFNVIAFLDNDLKKTNNHIKRIPIFLPDFLTDLEFDEIHIASQFRKDIFKQLKNLHIPSKKIFAPLFFQNNPASTDVECSSFSETSKCRSSLAQFCIGNGLDIGFGGDPIVPHAICLDLPSAYARYMDFPQHLHGDASTLYWFNDNVLDFVYSSHVLEDFIHTESVLREWIRVIKPTGKLVLFLPDEKLYQKHCKLNGKTPNQHHIHENFSVKFVEKILAKISLTKLVHKKNPVAKYSFELVVQKI